MSDIMDLQIPALLKKNGIKGMTDGGFDLTFSTQELGAAELASVGLMRGKTGMLVFSSRETKMTDAELSAIDVPDVSPEFKGQKSPGQRLRGVLYRLWENGGSKGDFETFYKVRMDRLIDQVKELLP